MSPYFLAEQRDGPGVDGRLGGHFPGLGGKVLADHRVDLGLDARRSRRRQRRAVAEVEAHPLAVHHLALLRHVRAQHMAQGRVHQVGRRVVGAGARPPLGVDGEFDLVADAQAPADELQSVDVHVSLLLGVGDLARAAGPGRLAAVAGLAAALGVEGRAVEQRQNRVAGPRLRDLLAVLDQGQGFGRHPIEIVAGEGRGAEALAQGQPHRALGLLARTPPSFPAPSRAGGPWPRRSRSVSTVRPLARTASWVRSRGSRRCRRA